jgi:spore coat polysaccharide biosynthesis predicted glycosyltransferase SpsG/RimJ/RimL family protein N-acetyltransferase
VDGYQFSAGYQRALKGAGFKILFLDDYGRALHYSADLVLNQNAGASEAHYADREPHTRLLLGPHYCLLRREFAPWQSWQRKVLLTARDVLVMMGGADSENLTSRAIEALARLDGLRATVLVGGSNPHLGAIQSAVADSGLEITLRQDVSNVAELMAAADVAISAAGSTCWELCLLGLPALIIDVADNQTSLARELDRTGCAVYAGDRTIPTRTIADRLMQVLNSHELRVSLAQRSRALVDGKGARRVVSLLRGPEALRLRRVRPDDVRLLWEWANDPEVRAASFSSVPISWATHVAWFTEKLGGGKSVPRASVLLIAEDDTTTPIGQIRFDARDDGGWEVDVSIAKEARGQGLAPALIKTGVCLFQKEHHDARLHALVKSTNEASIRAFEKADFKPGGAEQIQGHTTVHFIYEKD